MTMITIATTKTVMLDPIYGTRDKGRKIDKRTVCNEKILRRMSAKLHVGLADISDDDD